MLKSNYSPGKSLTTSTLSKKKSIKRLSKEGGPVSPSGKISLNNRVSANSSRMAHEEHENPEETQQMSMLQTFQMENQQLTFEMGEKDVEIDRMKTTLHALNAKL